MLAFRANETRSRVELRADELADDARVGLTVRPLHDLADEEAEQPGLAAAIGLDLALVLREHLVDDRLELRRVRERLLREVRVGAEPLVSRVRDRVVEGLAWDLLACSDELCELTRIHGSGIDARADELVRDHVRRRDRLGTGGARRSPERVESSGDERLRRGRTDLVAQPHDARPG